MSYELTLPSQNEQTETMSTTALGAAPPYFQVPRIGETEANDIAERKKMDDENVSAEERLALVKFSFNRLFALPLEHDFAPHGVKKEESKAFLRIKRKMAPLVVPWHPTHEHKKFWKLADLKENLKELMVYDAPRWATPQVLDAVWRGLCCPDGCEEEHDHETPERPEGYANPQNRGMFHNIKLEKLAVRNPDAALNTAAHYDFTSGFGDVRYVRKGYVAKLRLVRLLCDDLGLPHSCFAKTWTFAEWEAVAAKLVKEQVWSDDIVSADGSDFARTYKTSSLIKLLRGVFAVRTRRTGKDHPRRESLTVADDVSAVLTAWSLSEVKATLEKGSPRKQSVKAAAEAAGTELDFNKFQAETKTLFIAENRAEFLNPKRKGMLNQAGVSEIKRLFDAKKAELNLPADFKAGVTLPQEFSVALIPYLNLYEPLPETAGGGGGGGAAAPEQPKVGLLWHALPEQKPFKKEDEEYAKKKGLGRAAAFNEDE